MDALKGIGHACGHNLIGMAGTKLVRDISLIDTSDLTSRCRRVLRLACSPRETQHTWKDCTARNARFVLAQEKFWIVFNW